MIKIVVEPDGVIVLASYRRDGTTVDVSAYGSWRELMAHWGTGRWAIDNRRRVFVRTLAQDRRARHLGE